MDSTPVSEKKPPSVHSPFAGCAILITVVLVMVFLVGFSVLTLFRQYNEIAKFTSDKPAPVQVASIENREFEVNDLAERLEKLRQQLADGTETSIALTAEDLNLAIAAFNPFKDLRGTFHVQDIEDNALKIAISFQLNGKPRLTHNGESGVMTSDPRFLNGTMTAEPALLKNEVVLRITAIDVPGATVAPEFIDQMSPYRITERYLADPSIGSAMAKLTRVAITDGKVVLTRNPKETPVDMITREQVDSASTRLFTIMGVAACAFLAFAGLIVLIGVRAKARKQRDS